MITNVEIVAFFVVFLSSNSSLSQLVPSLHRASSSQLTRLGKQAILALQEQGRSLKKPRKININDSLCPRLQPFSCLLEDFEVGCFVCLLIFCLKAFQWRWESGQSQLFYILFRRYFQDSISVRPADYGRLGALCFAWQYILLFNYKRCNQSCFVNIPAIKWYGLVLYEVYREWKVRC